MVDQETSQSPLKDRAYTAYAVQFDSAKNKRSIRVSVADYENVIRFRILISNSESGTAPLNVDAGSSAEFGLRDVAPQMQFNASNIQELRGKIENLFITIATKKALDGLIPGKSWRVQTVDWGNYR